MKHFTPTLPAAETSKNVRTFMAANHETFWAILKPLLPFIIGLELMDVFINHLFFADSDKELALGSFISSYFIGALMISWHRVVIHGADRFVPMNPFKPEKSELAFMFVPFGLAFLYMLSAGLITILSVKFGNPGIAAVLLAVFVVFGVLAGFRISFYLPAKAVGANITMRESWNMTNGYVWPLIAAGFLSSWRVLLIAFVFAVAAGALGGALGGALLGVESLGFRLVLFICLLPVLAYAQPLITVIGVTVLSNYYQWAINNPRTAP